jgi:membrane-associated phospholipid phosphatase
MLHTTRRTLLLLSAIGSVAGAQTDTLPSKTLFTWRDAALAGGFVLGTVALHPVDEHYAEVLQNPRNQQNRFLQDVATVFRTTAEPGSVIIGVSMYTVGRLAKMDRVADLGLHGTEALVVGALSANVLKVAFGRRRPYLQEQDGSFNPDDWQFGRGWRSKDYRSFPSGHTVAGFAAAAAVTNETARWWPGSQWYIGPIMYGGATLIGLSRMYNNRHWASDVMLGAAVGIFAGNKVVRYHHRVNQDNRLDRWLLSVNVKPAPGGGAHLGFSLVPAPLR